MSLTNIKNKLQAERGFTIVELLIVVVVIAILAAISIVSYNGITTRANDSAAKAALSNVEKKAELYYAEFNGYPATATAFQSAGATYNIDASGVGSAAPTSANGKTMVQYVPCGTASTGTPAVHPGATVTYYEYAKSGTDKLTSKTIGTCS